MKIEQMKLLKFFFAAAAGFILFTVCPAKFHAQTSDVSVKLENSKPQQTKSPRKIKKGRAKKQLNQTKLLPVQTGNWGGTGINLSIDENAARIEYDCAVAEITQKFLIDERGNFNLNGFYTPQQGGAAQLGREPAKRPARFEGSVSGSKMIFKVTLTDTGDKFQDVVLELDKPGRIRHCY